MTIFFAALAALAFVAFGLVVRQYLLLKMEHGWTLEDYAVLERHHTKVRKQKEALELEGTVLRKSNTNALKVWQSERRRLWDQARDAERHAQDMQAFHLRAEQDLKHELAGTHALIELLLCGVPKGGVLTQSHEVRRLFRPVVEMERRKTIH